jgi:hypothetical protein
MWASGVAAGILLICVGVQLWLTYCQRRAAKERARKEAAQQRRHVELLEMVFGDPVVTAGLAMCSPEARIQLEAAIHVEVAWLAYADDSALERHGQSGT